MSAPPTPLPEAWLRGPVAGVSPALQPVAHALIQAREDVHALCGELPTGRLWSTPGVRAGDGVGDGAGAASVGFHLVHLAGSLDRLLSYASGEPITERQRAALARERDPDRSQEVEELLAEIDRVVELGLEQLRKTPDGELDTPRSVGRAGLPSSVRGLLYHAGEHTARHAGQISTTVRILRTGESGAEEGRVQALPLDHVAVAVSSIAEARPRYAAITGSPGGETIEVPDQGVNVAFFGGVELLEPRGEDTQLARFLASRGPGLHHLAFAVRDIRREIARLTEAGFRPVDPEPRMGASGHLIAFLHPRDTGGVLVELVEAS